MTPIQRYKLNEAIAQQRLDELSAETTVVGGDDVALTRLLIETHAHSNPTLSQRLLDTLTKVSNAAEAAAIRSGEYIPKSEIKRIASEMIAMIDESFGHLQGYSEAVDDFIDRLTMSEMFSATHVPKLENLNGDP